MRYQIRVITLRSIAVIYENRKIMKLVKTLKCAKKIQKVSQIQVSSEHLLKKIKTKVTSDAYKKIFNLFLLK